MQDHIIRIKQICIISKQNNAEKLYFPVFSGMPHFGNISQDGIYQWEFPPPVFPVQSWSTASTHLLDAHSNCR